MLENIGPDIAQPRAVRRVGDDLRQLVLECELPDPKIVGQAAEPQRSRHRSPHDHLTDLSRRRLETQTLRQLRRDAQPQPRLRVDEHRDGLSADVDVEAEERPDDRTNRQDLSPVGRREAALFKPELMIGIIDRHQQVLEGRKPEDAVDAKAVVHPDDGVEQTCAADAYLPDLVEGVDAPVAGAKQVVVGQRLGFVAQGSDHPRGKFDRGAARLHHHFEGALPLDHYLDEGAPVHEREGDCDHRRGQRHRRRGSFSRTKFPLRSSVEPGQGEAVRRRTVDIQQDVRPPSAVVENDSADFAAPVPLDPEEPHAFADVAPQSIESTGDGLGSLARSELPK